MSQGIKAVLPWMTFILSIILCAFLIYVAFFSYQAGKAPTVSKVEANITLVLAIILAILVGLLMIWSIIHLYQTNKTKPKPPTTTVVPESKPLTSKTTEAKAPKPVDTPSIAGVKTSEKAGTVTKPAKRVPQNEIRMAQTDEYTSTVSDPGSALQDLLKSK